MRKEERGALTIEASIVFPVMFIVIFLLIYLGNAYYQKSRVDALVSHYAILGAAQCSDPTLKTIQKGEELDFNDLDVKPYRQIAALLNSNVMNDTEEYMKDSLKAEFSSIDGGFFQGMEPRWNSIEAEYNGSFLNPTFMVTVNCDIKFPIRFLGSDDDVIYSISSKAEVPVSNVPEFIRNVNMIEDYMNELDVTDVVDKFTEKINGVINKIKEWGKKDNE